MTSQLRVLVPDATVNYVLNPAFLYDTTGWNAFGSSISRTTDRARFNIASLKVVTSGLLNREGAYYRVSALAGIGDVLTASVYVRGAGHIHLRLIDNPTGREWLSESVILNDERWQRVDVTGRCTGSNDLRMYIETNDRAQAITFYVDGAQMERKAYATTYCDGDQPGCRWDTLYHGSQSSRSAYTREGGRWATLAGPCVGKNDLYVTMIGGGGMPSLIASRQSYALNPGSYYQSVKAAQRILTFTFHVKNKSRVLSAPNLSPLHQLRQQLVDIFKPDVTAGHQSMLLEFVSGIGSVPEYIWATYEGGLEGQWDIRNQWVGSMALRFVADDPLFTQDNQEVASLKFKRRLLQTAAGAYNTGVMRRKEGSWELMNFSYLNTDTVLASAEDKYGNIFFVGNFESPSFLHDVAKWNGTTLEAMGIGVAGGTDRVECVAVDGNGNVYVGGGFTSINGVAANRIAMWNGSNWAALGSGLNSTVFAMIFAENGSLYVSGLFTQAGGMTVDYFARWDGSSWHALSGTTGAISRGNHFVLLDDNRTILVAGFGSSSSQWMYSGIGLIDTLTNTVHAIELDGGTYTDDYVGAVKDRSGSVWLSGSDSPDFSGIGTDTPHRYDRSGISFFSSQSGPIGDGSSEKIAILPSGMVVVFQRTRLWREEDEVTLSTQAANACYVPGLSYLDQGIHIPPDIDLGIESSITVRFDRGFVSKNGDLYMFPVVGTGGNTLGANVSDITDVSVDCSAPVWPTLEISGPGRLRWLENMSTGCILAFNILLSVDEIITIDFSNAKMISSTRGDVSWGMMSKRSLREFFLIPGNNRIVTFMFAENDNSSMRMRWVPRDWSADAVKIEASAS